MVSCLGLGRPWCEHVETCRSCWPRFLKYVRYFVGDGGCGPCGRFWHDMREHVDVKVVTVKESESRMFFKGVKFFPGL